jgi:parvulin-like peptidyl-prolyl isomerase
VRWFSDFFAGEGVDPERRNGVLVLAGIGLIIGLAIALVAYGYYNDRVKPRNDVVLKIGERKYTYAELEKRVKSDIAQGRFDIRDTGNSLSVTIAGLQREELTRNIARERGITATDAEIDDEIRASLNLGDEVTHDELGRFLRVELSDIKMSLDDYLEVTESHVLEDKIKSDLTASVPEEAEQVNLLLIQAGSQANAIRARDALAEGAEFADVAKQYSQDQGSSSDGVFGWAPRELLDPELADVAFSITGRSDIIETKDDFYIIDVLGKETRPVEETARDEIGTKEFNKLLETAFNETAFGYNMTDKHLLDLANAIGGSFGG